MDVSRCDATPAAGMPLVAVGCGDPAAESGARWQLHASPGPISLRSDPSLCIAAGPPVRAASGHRASPPSTPIMPGALTEDQTAALTLQALRWNSTVPGHGPDVNISKGGEWAGWRSSPGKGGCDGVALAASFEPPRPFEALSFWVQIKSPAPSEPAEHAGTGGAGAFVDVGWCLPSIDTSGKTWAGFQVCAVLRCAALCCGVPCCRVLLC